MVLSFIRKMLILKYSNLSNVLYASMNLLHRNSNAFDAKLKNLDPPMTLNS